jgi:hypothetical protein
MKIQESDKVVHDIISYEEFILNACKRKNLPPSEFLKRYGSRHYQERNQIIVDLLKKQNVKTIFEFACSMGYLADKILSNIPNIEKYTCTNFSPLILEFVSNQLKCYKNAELKLVDVDVTRSDTLKNEKLSEYDCILTTSFEHIQYDFELLNVLPKNKYFLFVVPTLICPEHFRTFDSPDEIKERYQKHLNIINIVPFTCDPKIHERRTFTFFIVESITL